MFKVDIGDMIAERMRQNLGLCLPLSQFGCWRVALHQVRVACPHVFLLMMLVSSPTAQADQLKAPQDRVPPVADATERNPSCEATSGRNVGPNRWRLGTSEDDRAISLDQFPSRKLIHLPFVIEGGAGQITLNGSNITVNDIGRNGRNDNAATITINSTEGVAYPTYVTNFGLLLNRHQISSGKGDRIAASFIQTCDAMGAGQSCVGDEPLAVAGGEGAGNYTGSNPRVLVPAGMNSVGNAIGQEINTETHSLVGLKYGLLIGDLNQSGPDNSTTHGKALDSAIVVSINPPPPATGRNNVGYRCDTCGFKNGITFGAATAGFPETFPILSGGTLLQAANPKAKLSFGFDLTGMGAGFRYGALALPVAAEKNGIIWGFNHLGGSISSTAKTEGPLVTFTDNGLLVQDQTGGKTLLGLFNDGRIQTTLYTPASSKATCTIGQIADDTNYHYVCVAEDKWRRVALTDF